MWVSVSVGISVGMKAIVGIRSVEDGLVVGDIAGTIEFSQESSL